MGLINTVLGYKKGSKTKNIFSMSENMMFELSNALSIVFISLKLVKIRQVKVLSVAPPKGHESLHFGYRVVTKLPKCYPNGTENFFIVGKYDV